MQGKSDNGVFCDYLALTYEPESTITDEIADFVSSSFICEGKKFPNRLILTARGIHDTDANLAIFPNYRKSVDRVVVGGKLLELLRSANLLHGLVQLASERPHNVTRCDLARDRILNSPAQYQTELNRVRKRGHSGKLSLRRKAVAKSKVIPLIRPRALDDVLSGSVMINKHSDRYSAIVYDKTAELYDKAKVVIGENLLRYEVRTTEASLRDVIDPDPLFFAIASPDLVRSPPGIPEWDKNLDLAPLNLSRLPELSPMQKVIRIIETSHDIERLCSILSETNEHHVAMARRKLNQRLDAVLKAMAAEAEENAQIESEAV